MKAASKRVLAVIAAMPMMLAVGIPVAHAGYPVKCDKQSVLVVEYNQMTEDFVATSYTTIQEAIDAADGDVTGSSVGDTVIVCPGTYAENISVPQMDSNDNTNLSIRSWNGPHEVTIVGDLGTADAVVDIDANGVNFGGAGLGFTIEAAGTPDSDFEAVVQVGTPMPVDLDQDDDQEITECDAVSGECPDEELAPLTPINVTVAGNEITGELVGVENGTLVGLAVNNSNNTLAFRNLIKDLEVTGQSLAYGIRYGDTNSNIDVLQNAVKELRQSGGDCTGSTLSQPTVGAVGIAAEDEALDATIFNNLVEKVETSCTAVGAYSNAWGGLENDRNGQQIPIVTDVTNNRIKKVESDLTFDPAAPQSAAVVLAPDPDAVTAYDGNPYDEDDPRPPSSFRVSTNDLDETGVGVAVFGQLATYTYVEQNNFDHDEVGVFNTGNENLDATNNWWGCDEGPYPADGDNSCATIGGAGTTYATPWLKHHVDHAGAHAGDHAGHK